jgi:two-component sensor histidine kinase/PAS domain-containing protein
MIAPMRSASGRETAWSELRLVELAPKPWKEDVFGDRRQFVQHLTDNDRNFLAHIAQTLPLLADLTRADVLVYVSSPGGESAVVLFEANPHTVPSIYTEPMLGRWVTRSEEPAVIRVLAGGPPAQRLNRVLVHGAPTIQDVYPIRNEGRVIGALVVEMGLLESERQKKKHIVYRRALAQLRQMVLRGQVEGAQNISRLGEHDGPFVVDSRGQILYISSIAENLYRKLGYTHSLLGRNVASLRTDESVFFKALETGACVEQTVQEGPLTWVKKAIPLVAQDTRPWYRRLLRPSVEIDGAIIVIHDITGERQREQELRIKSAMIQEIHHRVKNNLQTIAALLRLQARRSGSPEVAEILRQTINRILSIAVVHEFLAYDEESIVNLKELAQRIINEVSQSIVDPEKHLRFHLDGVDIWLPAQHATSCALIINELLQNAVKHGYPAQAEGTITVTLRDEGDQIVLRICDDGQGLTPGASRAQESSLGLQIVRTLVREDLKGTFDLESQDGRGTRATVTFPKTYRTARTLAWLRE